jgi:hypothetical protein
MTEPTTQVIPEEQALPLGHAAEGTFLQVYEDRRAAIREFNLATRNAEVRARMRGHLEAALGNEVSNNRLDAELDRHLAELRSGQGKRGNQEAKGEATTTENDGMTEREL